MTHCQSRLYPGQAPPPPRGWACTAIRVRVQTEACWEEEDSPRLLPTDLEDPDIFRQRLEAWLKKQK